MSIFKKKKNVDKPGEDVVILRQPPKNACGGTTVTQDRNAPTDIECREVILFDTESALGMPSDEELKDGKEPLCFVSAFAAPAGGGSFVYYSSGRGFGRRRDKGSWALIRKDIFPELDGFVRKYDIARNNGLTHTTHGLPENFGGSISVDYSDGEKIRFSDNQSPVLERSAGAELDAMFRGFLSCPRIAIPDAEDIVEILFEEIRDDGYTKALCRINDDGTATNIKDSKYGDSVYHSEKPVDAETVNAMITNVKDTALLVWRDLPDSKFGWGREKTLAFRWRDGSEISTTDCKAVPDGLSRGFFNIELELATKH